MNEITLTVTNETGLHSRPADLFVRTAKLFDASITVHKGEKSADAKNILKVILLNVTQGDEIRVSAEGSEASVALEELRKLVESDFRSVNSKVKI